MTAAFASRFNGVDVASLSALPLASSRGLHYGDGVFRTLLKHDGQLLDSDRQFAKLASDASRLGLQSPEVSLLRDDIEVATADRSSATVKLMLFRSGQQRGYRAKESAADRLVLAYPASRYPADKWARGITAFRSSVVMADQPLLAGVKHLNRLEQVLSGRDWQDDADEGILCDRDGKPVCGTRSNLFWIDDDGLHTPALDRCGVAGIMRDRVIEAARASGMPVHVVPGEWIQLMEAREAFVTNSLIGIWPLHALLHRRWEAPGAFTQNLASMLRHPRLSMP